jgi:hypothetical protein
MLNLISHSLNPKDEPTLQQLQIYLQYLSQDKKAAIVMTAIYEATEPSAVDFDHVCDCLRHCAPRNRCSYFNKAIALLQNLPKPGLLAVAKALLDELAVLEQLQEVWR